MFYPLTWLSIQAGNGCNDKVNFSGMRLRRSRLAELERFARFATLGVGSAADSVPRNMPSNGGTHAERQRH